MNIKILLLGLFSVSLMLFVSCDPASLNVGQPTNEDLQAVNDNNNVEKGMIVIMAAANPYGIDEDLSGTKKVNVADPDVSWYDKDSFAILFDYSNVLGCSGSLVIYFSENPLNPYLDSISATIDVRNLRLGKNLYSGNLLFKMKTVSGVRTFEIETPEGKFFNADSATWSGIRTLSWVEGSGTPSLKDDDIYQVVGHAHGVTSKGSNYTSIIEDPMICSPACDFNEAGQLTITNHVGESNQAALTLVFNVDDKGNVIEASCNNWVKLHYVTANLDITQILDLDNL